MLSHFGLFMSRAWIFLSLFERKFLEVADTEGDLGGILVCWR
jgi:hypothetical protein